ncbi:MAG: hypothetical protein QGH42_13095 [Kiritimatiellia bacterium]|jgi:hypothetical protein|nr:hypothetical protein [Kiritimatiellia bacterium]MDP6629849.1 hypothetical protein [Kiritimatiellia bacterium]MDP6809728.1 hypothetical protein [Kiritimatiellia bacterium]MDP7025162.1 hypothetical protein [Kiritimatiellia bacterium]
MKKSVKPVRKCHACLLNLGDHCWLYRYPRGQWRGGKRCRAFDDETLYTQFRTWQKQPTVKTRRELRREFFRTKKKDGVQAEK